MTLPISPWVILSDFGSAFAMGAVGGTIWHGIKGARNSPRVCLPNVTTSETILLIAFKLSTHFRAIVSSVLCL